MTHLHTQCPHSEGLIVYLVLCVHMRVCVFVYVFVCACLRIGVCVSVCVWLHDAGLRRLRRYVRHADDPSTCHIKRWRSDWMLNIFMMTWLQARAGEVWSFLLGTVYFNHTAGSSHPVITLSLKHSSRTFLTLQHCFHFVLFSLPRSDRTRD